MDRLEESSGVWQLLMMDEKAGQRDGFYPRCDGRKEHRELGGGNWDGAGQTAVQRQKAKTKALILQAVIVRFLNPPLPKISAVNEAFCMARGPSGLPGSSKLASARVGLHTGSAGVERQ
jgi:hypothetical protein